MNRSAALAFIALAAVAILLVGGGVLGSQPAASQGPSALAAGSSAPAESGAPSDGTEPSGAPTASATPSALPSGSSITAIVAVTNFRSAYTATSLAEVRSVLAGTSSRYDSLELVKGESGAILAALDSAPSGTGKLVLAADATTLGHDLAAHRKRLAFLRADAVTPAVRALAWGDRSLFGVGRVASRAAWPLKANLPAAAPAGAASGGYDPAKAWTLVAGGDILLDRGVAKTVKLDGRGIDFPFNGGTADITSRCKDCSVFGWDLPRTRRTDNAGAVRRLLSSADLTIANFENPAPDAFRYHTSGTVFSADPKLIGGLANAGIDYVSLANNHIRDAGGQGILDTIANLDKRHIAHSGAGRNLAAARRPAIFEKGGVRIAILGYDTIARTYAASATRAGSAQLSAAVVRQDVAAARKAGADLVIVFPHWGTEYDPTPFAGQRRLAEACIDAGADMVIGNHAHWAGAMEVYQGKPIWYALGNFVFDQTWSEPTMEGMTLELTFQGADLIQARMRPHIILDKAQPNFLDPAGAGRVVMGQVFQASKGLLAW